jgi:hypothetical protein
MSTEKILNTRYQLKIDTTENWNKAINFIPKKGEPIIYKDDNSLPRIKIGDGITKVIDLPFLNQEQIQADWTQTDETAVDYIKNKPTIATDEDAMDLVTELGYVTPVASSDGSIYIKENGVIYSL